MEDKKILNKSLIIKWAIISVLTSACLAGIIFEAVLLGTASTTTKLGLIHIGQYAVMIFCIYLPIILEALHFKVGYIVWGLFYLFVFLAIFVGSIINVYDKFAQWDVVVHAFSGALIALFALSLIKDAKNPWVCLLIAISIAVFVGVLWEFYEYSFDYLLKLNMQRTASPITGAAYTGRAAINDTMLDLFSDFAGALVSGILCVVFRNRLGSALLITYKKDKAPKA